jgi:hypothetical protein
MKGAVVRVHGVEAGHTGQPPEDRSIAQDVATKQPKGGSKAHGQNSITEPFHFQGS